MADKQQITSWFRDLQQRICTALEGADGGATFRSDAWERPGGGGGDSRVIADGRIIEKGGVNFSAVWGKTPEAVAKSMNLPHGSDFYATGVSIVIHPHNPFVPIIHMNVRYFEMSTGQWWFGGGIDLTPHYVDHDDARYFHRGLKAVCDRHDPMYYTTFRKWADDYFFIRHRNETRGIGGIFFDHLTADGPVTKQSLFRFVQDVGEAFAPLYTKLMVKHHTRPFDSAHKAWQFLRRGRYVEFNLVWDRGTRFGLETDGRTESILMSLPPHASWAYDHKPREGSEEEATWRLLRKDVDWIGNG